MNLTKNKQKHLEFTKNVYRILREKDPKKFGMLTDELAEKMVNNEANNRLHEKSVEILKFYDNKSQKYDKLVDDNKLEIISPMRRFAKETFNPELTDEENLKILTKYTKEDTSIEDATSYMNKVLDLDSLNIGTKTEEEIIDLCKDEHQVISYGFIAQHSLTEMNDYKAVGDSKKFISDNMPLFQDTANYKSVLKYHANPFSTIFPAGLEFSSSDLDFLSKETLDYVKEFEKDGIDGFKTLKINDFVMNNTTNDFMLYNENYKKYEKDKNAHITLQKLGIKNNRDLITNHTFKDKEGNVLSNYKVIEQITDGSLKIEDLTHTLKSKEEVEKIEKTLKAPFKTTLEKDPKLKVEYAKDLYKLLTDSFGEEFIKSEFSEEDLINRVSDPKNLELKNKAEIYVKKMERQQKICNRICADEGLKLDKSVERLAFLYMNYGLSEEENNKNKEFLRKLSTREGAREFMNQELKKISNIDYSKVFYKTKEEYVEHYEENFDTIKAGFVIKSCIDNGHFDTSKEYDDFIKNNIEVIQNVSEYQAAIEAFSNPLSQFIPIFDLNGKNPVDAFKTGDVVKFSSGLQAINEKYKDEAIGVEKYDLNHGLKFFTDQINVIDSQRFSTKFLKAVEEGKISKTPQKDNYFIDKETKEVVTIQKYLLNPDKCEVKELTEQQKFRIEKMNEQPMKSRKIDFLKEMFAKKNELMEQTNNIKNAKAVFSFLNSPEYDTLKGTIDELHEFLNKDEFSGENPIENLNEEQVRNNSTELQRILKDLRNNAAEYAAKKHNQSKNQTRQTRYDNCLRILKTIDEDYLDNALPVDNNDKYTSHVSLYVDAPINQLDDEIYKNVKWPIDVSNDLDKSFEIDEENAKDFADLIELKNGEELDNEEIDEIINKDELIN